MVLWRYEKRGGIQLSSKTYQPWRNKNIENEIEKICQHYVKNKKKHGIVTTSRKRKNEIENENNQ